MSGQHTLPEWEDWPIPSLKLRDHRVIRHAWEETLSNAARLALFGNSKPKDSELLSARQEELVVSDIVNFALHTRRLIEATGTRERFEDLQVPLANGQDQVHFLNVINKIIHHQRIEVFRTRFSLELLAADKSQIWDCVANADHRAIIPMMFVASDRGEPIIVKIHLLIEIFETKLLAQIDDLCGENGLFLDDPIA